MDTAAEARMECIAAECLRRGTRLANPGDWLPGQAGVCSTHELVPADSALRRRLRSDCHLAWAPGGRLGATRRAGDRPGGPEIPLRVRGSRRQSRTAPGLHLYG